MVAIISSSPWLRSFRALLGCDHLELSLVVIISSSPWSRSSQTLLHVSCGGTLAAAVGRRSWLGRIWASSRFSPVLLPFQSSSAFSSTPAQPPISPAGAAVVLPSSNLSQLFLGFTWGFEDLNFFSILLRIWPQPPFPPRTVTYSISVKLETAKVYFRG